MTSTLSATAVHPRPRVRIGAYVLPLARSREDTLGDLPTYLTSLVREVEVIVVDGSPAAVFQSHALLLPKSVVHVPVDPRRLSRMGKVGGVLTGLERTGYERVVIADDDVRYDTATLRRVIARLDDCDVVRPQNYFQPLRWHAFWDGSRSLLNRAVGGGDWPGTLAVRRRVVLEAGGYRGDVMFENLELVRTIRAAGGREVVARDLHVARRPPSTRDFLGQRVRQAYDELARPGRMAFFLALHPALVLGTLAWGWVVPLSGAAAAVAVAETGRRRDLGRDYFPVLTSAFAPLWLLERGVTMWLAVGCRLLLGGVPYRGGRLRRAASSSRELRQQLQQHQDVVA